MAQSLCNLTDVLPLSCAVDMQPMVQVYRTSQPELKRQAPVAASTGDLSIQLQAPTNSESPISAPSLTGPGERASASQTTNKTWSGSCFLKPSAIIQSVHVSAYLKGDAPVQICSADGLVLLYS